MISLIATVRNERDNVEAWLEGLLRQSRSPDEIVIVDGGSDDGTWPWLLNKARELACLRVFQCPGNISVGRNCAIKKARGEVIVVTDAGCSYDREWFRRITEPIVEGKARAAATAYGPWLEPKDKWVMYVIAACTTPAPREFFKEWLPSSRSVAFVKDVWRAVGGYPEWLPICEDVIYDLKIKAQQIEFARIREPMVFWRPRPSLRKYMIQLYRYTRGDGHGKLWWMRQFTRYTVYGGSLALLASSVKAACVVLPVGGVIYSSQFWRRWYKFSGSTTLARRVGGYFVVPLVVGLGDVAKMCGWPVGVLQRISGKVRFEEY